MAVTSQSYTSSNYLGLTKAVIPETVTYDGITYSVTIIDNYAFSQCEGLTSVTMPESITDIGASAFENCLSLTSITIPNSVIYIGMNAFKNCSSLTSITIPNSVTSIENETFRYCTDLTSITIPESVTNIGVAAFSDCAGLISVVVESGNSVYDSRNNCNAIIETATNALIVGCKNTVIPNSVMSIDNGAFNGIELTTIIIPNSVTNIGAFAFGRTGLTSIVSYAMVPPTCGSGVFISIPEDAVLYVPCAALADYKLADGWNAFANIQCISSEEVEIPANSIIVTPSESDVTITWPNVDNAENYTLEITKDDVVFCTLTFNANGQLMGIAFAPSKDRNNAHAPQAAQATVNGWQFTVTGLNESSNYAYTLTVADNRGTELQTYNGTFRTLGTTALDNVNATDAVPVQKIFRNGQVLILRGNEVYTVLGEKVE